MTTPEQKTFHCDVIDPTGKLLDCEATSVVVPAHDGQRGILYDHMPMLCQLGLGLMRVTVVSSNEYQGPAQAEAVFFVDGGFALVAANTVMVVAYDAFTLQDIKPEKIQSLVERTHKNLAAPTLSVSQRAHENERLRALQKLAPSPETR
jgi:F-type H+-transporting ATPase subunit epsilon